MNVLVVCILKGYPDNPIFLSKVWSFPFSFDYENILNYLSPEKWAQ